MCRFIRLTSEMQEIEEWFKDFDRRIEHYENKAFIIANSYPLLPVVTREGILKASSYGRNKIHLSLF